MDWNRYAWYEKLKKRLKGIVHVCYAIKFVEFILSIKDIKSYLSKAINKKQGFFVNISFIHVVVNEDLQITDN